MAGKITAVIFCSAFYLTLAFFITPFLSLSLPIPPNLLYLFSQFLLTLHFCCHRVRRATLVPEAHCEVSMSGRQDPGSLVRMFMPAFA